MHPSALLYSSGLPTIIAVNFDSASAILYCILPTSFLCLRLARVIIICFIVVWFLITATKIRRLFHISKFFLTFFILFFIACNYTYICRLFRFAGVPLFSGGRVFRWSCVPVVCRSWSCVLMIICPHSYARAYTRTHTRAHGDF